MDERNVLILNWSVDSFSDLSAVWLRASACGYTFDINAGDRGGFDLNMIDDDTDEIAASVPCRTIDEAKEIAESILAQLVADVALRFGLCIGDGEAKGVQHGSR